MKYIAQMEAFTDKAFSEGLSPAAHVVYLYLFKLNNSLRWVKTFKATYDLICLSTGISSKTARRAIEELTAGGYILVRKSVNGQKQLATSFSIVKLYSEKDIASTPAAMVQPIGESMGEVIGESMGEKFPYNEPAIPTAPMDSAPSKTIRHKDIRHKDIEQPRAREEARADRPDATVGMEEPHTSVRGPSLPAEKPKRTEEEQAALGRITRLYESGVRPYFSAIDHERLTAAFDRYGEAWCAMAIKEMARSGGQSVGYVEKILARYERDGCGSRGQSAYRKKPAPPVVSPAEQAEEDEAEKERQSIMGCQMYLSNYLSAKGRAATAEEAAQMQRMQETYALRDIFDVMLDAGGRGIYNLDAIEKQLAERREKHAAAA